MMERKMIRTLGYEPNHRVYKNIKTTLSRFVGGDINGLVLPYKNDDAVYSGLEHQGNPKLPNATILPNLRTIDDKTFLNTTTGHQHLQKLKGDERKFQEIYEFFGYGAILLRNNSGANLHILKRGEKVVVGTDDNMTLFNLDDSELQTLDYANPAMNSANKDLETSIGPLLLIIYDPVKRNLRFTFNRKYYEQKILAGDIEALVIDIPFADLGEPLYQRMPEFGEHFRKAGIELVIGGNIPEEHKNEFAPGLLSLVLNRNPTLFRSLALE